MKNWEEGNVPKTKKKKLLGNVFTGKFTFSGAQIDMMLSEKERFRSKKWTNADYCSAMELRCTGVKSLNYVRKNLLPLPAYPTLCKKFAFMHLTPGFLKPMMAYLSKILPLKEKSKRACMLLFDETKVTNRGHLDKKLDMVIGANKKDVSLKAMLNRCN